jgi:hypothetical protein
MGVVVENRNPVCVGIDVGQIQDPTAISVAEVEQIHTGKYRWINPIPGHFTDRGEWIPPVDADPVMTSEYNIRNIRRLPLGTSYPDVAIIVAEMLCNPLFSNRSVRVLIDVTGVGRPVYEDLKREIKLRKEAQHVHLKPISFVHGETYNRSKGTLGKAFLVSRLQSLLQGGRVHAPMTPEVKVMLEELRVYEIKVNEAGKDTYGAEIGKHDDLATALALSCLEDPYGERVTYSRRVY